MVVKMFILGRRCVHTNVMKFLLQIFLKGKKGFVRKRQLISCDSFIGMMTRWKGSWPPHLVSSVRGSSCGDNFRSPGLWISVIAHVLGEGSKGMRNGKVDHLDP
jgi:hypothetical protein